ncbi:hypothetical protein V3330_02660 [Wenzhouxiangellaceae bacterium CH-27]|uniref:Muconolactone isomerase domain-containing protein n=1 Tax=Elongatibacter sediminis TaxID=3119006 RepID=A0AAW9R568_9GAMM
MKTNDGPGFATPDEAAEVLENGIILTFNALAALNVDGRILVGGLPVGTRTIYLIVEAPSHDEVDRMLRDLPAWGVFSWKVVPLQSIEGRAAMGREILASLKAGD